MVMVRTLSPEAYAREAAAAYEASLLEQARQYGAPATDPATEGHRAAGVTIAGQAWDADIGGFYDTAGARAALGGVSKQAVSERVRQGRLLGLPLASDGHTRDRLVYPVWQFRPGLLRHLPRVLAVAGYEPDRPTTGWTIAMWLVTPDPDLGGAPLEAIETGELDAVLAAAADIRASLSTDERAAHGAA